MSVISAAKISRSSIEFAPSSTTLVRNVLSVSQSTDAPIVDIFTRDEYNDLLPFIYLGIYPFLGGHDHITKEQVNKIVKGYVKSIPLIYSENIKDYLFSCEYEKLSMNPFDSQSLFSDTYDRRFTILMGVITNTFYSRLGYKPRNPFLVDHSMFIFRGGFISSRWGRCGDWFNFFHLYKRWIMKHWDPYPLNTSQIIRAVVSRSVEKYIDTEDKEISKLIDSLSTSLKNLGYLFTFSLKDTVMTSQKRVKCLWVTIADVHNSKFENYNITAIMLHLMNDFEYIMYDSFNEDYEISQENLYHNTSEYPFGKALITHVRDQIEKRNEELFKTLPNEEIKKSEEVSAEIDKPPEVKSTPKASDGGDKKKPVTFDLNAKPFIPTIQLSNKTAVISPSASSSSSRSSSPSNTEVNKPTIGKRTNNPKMPNSPMFNPSMMVPRFLPPPMPPIIIPPAQLIPICYL